ncbi:Atxe2 family lasso peptide isopeptidase [Peristeroidobacter soli]|uniref:Atxe2 family lasso peptide isopeptidase n=1 Tax=Peristeroidobacter soli TaxID=2497877 RepID=UPI00101D3223|nr:Atxe2 family lasso peptide isopeptidase [Peristeroidobacter soli]
MNAIGLRVCAIILIGSTLGTSAASERSAHITAEDLLSLRSIGGTAGTLSIAPDGASMALQVQTPDIAARTYRSEWYVLSLSGGAPVPVGDGGEPMLSQTDDGMVMGSRVDLTAQWSPDGKWIAYLRKDADEVQLWRSRADGSAQEQLTRSAAEVMDFAWSADGRSLYFEIGRARNAMVAAEQQEGDRGFLIDDRFMPDASRKPLWPRCQRTLASTDAPRACVTSLRTVDLDRVERAATAEEQQRYAAIKAPSNGADASRRIVSYAIQPTQSRSAWLENEKPTEFPGHAAPVTLYADQKRCDADVCHGQLRRLWWRDDELVFLRREGHAFIQSALYAWSPNKHRPPRLIYRTDDKIDACEIARGQLVCLSEAPTLPQRVVAIDLKSGARRVLFDPNPDFARFDLGRIERLEWHDAFGNPTLGHLVLPPGPPPRKPLPLIIVQYRSRGFLSGGTGNEYPIYPLAAAGFAVLSFDCPIDWDQDARLDYRNQLGASAAISLKDSYERRMDLTALDIVIDKLDQRGVIDPKRVGITGLSHGADNIDYMLFNSTRFAAAAVSGAWSRPHYFYLNPNNNYRTEMIKGALSARTAAEVLEHGRKESVVFNVDKVTAPLLIQTSASELLASLPLHVALLDAGKAVESYVFPDEYHIKWQPQHKLAVAERSIDWFSFWLMGREDSAASKAQQYQRWRKLRLNTGRSGSQS